jgi:uncharacterized membrane protein (DUF2068 family)
VRTRRWQGKRHISYELLDCALHGHVLVGTDVEEIRPEDSELVRDMDGLRWYRCLRCDAWTADTVPVAFSRKRLPGRDEITLPARGRVLRDRYVLRLISLDRGLHFVILTLLAVAVFVVAADKTALHRDFLRIVTALQGGVGGPVRTNHGTIEKELTHLFAVSTRNLELTGLALAAYAVLEGVEAVGLWRGKRWAEYLTFLATILLLPLEIYELGRKPTALKGLTFAINLAIAVYLIIAKRLFGVRGGHAAERRVQAVDSGWPAIEATTPRPE